MTNRSNDADEMAKTGSGFTLICWVQNMSVAKIGLTFCAATTNEFQSYPRNEASTFSKTRSCELLKLDT